MFSPLDDPEHWLSQEREARAAAKAASHAKAREFLLRLAEDYRKRAEKSEERRKRARLDGLSATA
jgi:hypothetical protein